MNLKLISSLTLVALAAIFILQNANVVEMHFLFWKVSMSRALMFVFLVLIGMAIGWWLRGHALRKAQRREPKEQ
jgi:uncharacterized integral membrane protein